MTKLLKQAFEKAAEELSAEEQDEFARWLIAMVESDDRRWEVAFAKSQDHLERMADRALEAYRQGLTEPLDSEKL